MFWLVLVPLLLQTQAAPVETTPAAAEQDRILAAMHDYADQYVANLPNFLCAQTTRQLESDLKGKRWHSGDTLVSTLSFHDGEERRALELVNGKPVEAARKRWRMPLTSEGEFGTLLSRVLGKESAAYFSWNRWDVLSGKRVAVFDYSVDKEHSTLSLRLSDLAHAVVPYRGSVYADPATGAVWRIDDVAPEIPAALQTRAIATTVDYAEVNIGNRSYLLPSQATVSVLTWDRKIRNEISFAQYRKFTADSSITFDAGEAGGKQ